MQSQQQSLSPDVQAVLDLSEIQGMPLWYEDGKFCTHKIKLNARIAYFDYNETAATWRIETVLGWIESFKMWSPVHGYKS